jgi:hypothetical protein
VIANQATLAVPGGESRIDRTGLNGSGSSEPKNRREVITAPSKSQKKMPMPNTATAAPWALTLTKPMAAMNAPAVTGRK